MLADRVEPTHLLSARGMPAWPASGPELRIAGTAAQTRMVSGGELLVAPTGVITISQIHGSRTDRARISEFESYHPSHAVGL
jgi:hypothetical protein